jgi:hypothetical protein
MFAEIQQRIVSCEVLLLACLQAECLRCVVRTKSSLAVCTAQIPYISIATLAHTGAVVLYYSVLQL